MTFYNREVIITIGDPAKWRLWGETVTPYIDKYLTRFLQIMEADNANVDPLWCPLELNPHGNYVMAPVLTFDTGEVYTDLNLGFVWYDSTLDLIVLSYGTEGDEDNPQRLSSLLLPSEVDEESVFEILLAIPLYRVVEGNAQGHLVVGTEKDHTAFPAIIELQSTTRHYITSLFLK